MWKKLNSRKFWMALISAGILLVNQGLGLDIPSDTVLGFAGIVMSYLVAQGLVDSKSNNKDDNKDGE